MDNTTSAWVCACSCVSLFINSGKRINWLSIWCNRMKNILGECELNGLSFYTLRSMCHNINFICFWLLYIRLISHIHIHMTHLYFMPFSSPRAMLAVSKLYVSWSLINAAAAPFKSSSDGNFITFRCIVTFSKNSKATYINHIELNWNLILMRSILLLIKQFNWKW